MDKPYALLCAHCGRRILMMRHVEDSDLRTMAAHLRADHPGALVGDDPPAFAAVIRHFTLALAQQPGSGWREPPR